MIGQKFPTTTVNAVMANGSINEEFSVSNYADGKYSVVFFYPLDFTFVCPTEILAFNKAASEFEKRGCKLIGASVDSHFSHAAWRDTPLAKGGIGPVDFPLISDMERKLSSELGILADGGVTYRAAYLIDGKGVVRHMVINDLPLGRNVEEMLRMVDALEFFEKNGEVCPANWTQGEEGLQTTSESTGAYLAKKHGNSTTAAA